MLWPAAAAGSATVELRVEGLEETIHEGSVTSAGHPVDGGDGSGPRACSGPAGEPPGPTALGALDDALRPTGVTWRGRWDPSFRDFFIDRIGPDASDAERDRYWSLLVGGRFASGGCSTRVATGDRVLFAYGVLWRDYLLRLRGPARVAPGAPFEVRVLGAPLDVGAPPGEIPIAGAAVGSATTGANGRAALRSPVEPGVLELKAEREDAIRSNALFVCVGVDGPRCRGNGGRPRLLIAKLTNGLRFAWGAGPRILRGDRRGEGPVELWLRAHRKGRCRSWRPARGLVARTCARHLWFRAGADESSWRSRVGPLAPGRYQLRARTAGTRRGVHFRVIPRRFGRAPLARDATHFLRRSMHPNGGFGAGPGRPANLTMSGWGALALGLRGAPAARETARFIRRRLGERPSDANLARSAAALVAAGMRSGRRPGRLLRLLVESQDEDGSFGRDTNTTALAGLALGAGAHHQAAAAERARRWLLGEQRPDGGFGYRPGVPADVDTTGLATWALASGGELDAARLGASYVAATQRPDGGFPALSGSNAQSTALGAVALRAAGIAPRSVPTEDGIDPLERLAALGRGNGAIRYSDAGANATPVWVTSQALLALVPRQALLELAQGE